MLQYHKLHRKIPVKYVANVISSIELWRKEEVRRILFDLYSDDFFEEFIQFNRELVRLYKTADKYEFVRKLTQTLKQDKGFNSAFVSALEEFYGSKYPGLDNWDRKFNDFVYEELYRRLEGNAVYRKVYVLGRLNRPDYKEPYISVSFNDTTHRDKRYQAVYTLARILHNTTSKCMLLIYDANTGEIEEYFGMDEIYEAITYEIVRIIYEDIRFFSEVEDNRDEVYEGSRQEAWDKITKRLEDGS